MKKQMKKLMLTKETLRGLEKRDGLGYVAGGLTVVSGCNYCPTGSCCTCANGCDTTGGDPGDEITLQKN